MSLKRNKIFHLTVEVYQITSYIRVVKKHLPPSMNCLSILLFSQHEINNDAINLKSRYNYKELKKPN